MHPRTREQLEGMTPERRAKAEALMAKHRTAEARARQSKAVDAIETEVEKTGGITTADGTFHRILTAQSVGVDLARVGRELRVRREALGLSLDDAARSSGVEGSALAKLERGANPNPTVRTLARVAHALGGRIAIGFEPFRE